VEVGYVFQSLEDLPAGHGIPPGRVKPWGTGHAVLRCRPAVDSPFAVINADDYYGPSSFRALRDFLDPAGGRARRRTVLHGGLPPGKHADRKRPRCQGDLLRRPGRVAAGNS
jgi:hypothetical protein